MKNKTAASIEEMTHVGALIELYRDHIKAAYDLAKKMKEVGIERPWITVIEHPSFGGPSQVTKFNLDVPVKLRLEIR